MPNYTHRAHRTDLARWFLSDLARPLYNRALDQLLGSKSSRTVPLCSGEPPAGIEPAREEQEGLSLAQAGEPLTGQGKGGSVSRKLDDLSLDIGKNGQRLAQAG